MGPLSGVFSFESSSYMYVWICIYLFTRQSSKLYFHIRERFARNWSPKANVLGIVLRFDILSLSIGTQYVVHVVVLRLSSVGESI